MTSSRPRLLLLSGYDAVSHRWWRTQLVEACPQYEWEVIAGTPRNFAWRLRGAPLLWRTEAQKAQQLDRPYDGVVATSTVDISIIRAIFPSLRSVPILLYMHENQFAYPPGREQVAAHHVDACMVQLYSVLTADKLVFNSEYNRTSMREQAQAFFRKLPDRIDFRYVDEKLSAAEILPVPVEDGRNWIEARAEDSPSRTILWNHRWEYDKAPERFVAAIDALAQRGVSFRLMLLGEQFRTRHPALEALIARHGDRIVHQGMIASRADYFSAIARADVAISTSLHDFQGLSMLEAALCGVRPVVPDRLAYREIYTEKYRYRSDIENPKRECEALVEHLLEIWDDKDKLGGQRAMCEQLAAPYLWDALASRYDATLRSLIDDQE